MIDDARNDEENMPEIMVIDQNHNTHNEINQIFEEHKSIDQGEYNEPRHTHAPLQTHYETHRFHPNDYFDLADTKENQPLDLIHSKSDEKLKEVCESNNNSSQLAQCRICFSDISNDP